MYQLGIIGGQVVDGSGREPYRANVYVEDGKIARITQELLPARETVDAEGLAVTPGFIDVHTHSDATPWCAPGFESYVHQGVTTSINGNCGSSLVPHRPEDHEKIAKDRTLSKYGDVFSGSSFTATDTAGYLKEINGICAINNGTLIGHGELRKMCMSDPLRTLPTEEELDHMCRVLRENLAQGAFGLSLGLIYLPGTYAQTEELIALARVVKEFDALLTVHMRNEGSGVLEALEEMATVARATGVHVEISHLKIAGWPGHGDELLERMDAYKAEGLNFSYDQYPYSASSTGLAALIPSSLKQRPHEEVMRMLVEDERYEKELKDILEKQYQLRPANRVLIAYTRGRAPECDGKNMEEISRMWQLSPAEATRQLLIKTNLVCQTIFFSMEPDDCRKIASRMDVAVISDSTSFDFLSRPVPGLPHPRNFGSFVRFLRLAREQKLMPFEKAVYKMTGLPAKVFEIEGRGLIREGYYADLVVLDPETVSDNGDFQHPARLSSGIRRVFVNGVLAFADGKMTGSRSGMGIAREV